HESTTTYCADDSAPLLNEPVNAYKISFFRRRKLPARGKPVRRPNSKQPCPIPEIITLRNRFEGAAIRPSPYLWQNLTVLRVMLINLSEWQAIEKGCKQSWARLFCRQNKNDEWVEKGRCV
ncbi:MAG: hypothetical protein L0229_28900, partial [Blastocatellia bacterium]|nr:hypothetical protein [Blastocatellia bacterium]